MCFEATLLYLYGITGALGKPECCHASFVFQCTLNWVTCMPMNASICALQPLPRQLWELRSSSAHTSLLMLRMLHSAGACARPGGPISAAVQQLQDQLMPCFLSVQLLQQPGKAAQKPKQSRLGSHVRLVAGPLARLSPACQVRLRRRACWYTKMEMSARRSIISSVK